MKYLPSSHRLRSNKPLLTSLAACIAFGAGVAHAETGAAKSAAAEQTAKKNSAAKKQASAAKNNSGSENPEKLKDVVVTANPVIEETHLDEFSDVSSVVTEEQLRDQNAVDLASALRRTPGVQITRFNPVGSFGGNEGGGIFIRGMGASRPGSEIKTYVDGVPFYLPVWNHPLLDLLPINGMKSITVHKSPQLQINGNNFASVNLETKRATEDGLHGSGRISGGFMGTAIEQADLAGKYGDLDFSLAQGYARSDGNRKDADGELKNVMGRIGYQLNDNWAIGTHFLYTNNIAKDPGDNRVAAPAVAPEYTTEAGMVSVNLEHQYEHAKGDLRLYTTTGEGNWYNHPNSPPWDNRNTNTLTSFDTYGLRWTEELSLWKGGNIATGVDSDWTTGDVEDQVGLSGSQGHFKTPSMRVTSPHFAVSQSIDLAKGWELLPSAGLRYYDHSHFSSRVAPHAGLSLISEKMTVFANIARGINYPGQEVATLAAFMPSLANTWKAISPEQVDHAEFGVKLSPTDSTQIDASVFNDRVENRYMFQFAPTPTFLNLGSYQMNGAEIAIKQGITEDWSVFGGLTLLDPSLKNLPYAPKRAVTAGVNGQIAKIRLAFDVQYQSDVWAMNRGRDGSTNVEQINTITVVNARASYPIPALGKKGEVFIAGENLFNRDYGYRPGYPMPGIWGQIGFAASF